MYDISLLYAEDDIALQQQYLKLFQILFKEVYVANDGEEGWNIYNKYKPQMMIFDINMPKIDGLTLTSMIRENDQQSKIIILTAYGDTQNLLQAITLKLTSYLIKPIKLDKLTALLHTTANKIVPKSVQKINKFHSYDTSLKILFEATQQVELTKNEIKLIELFLDSEQLVVPIETIFDSIWDDFTYSMTKLRSLINRLNSKLTQKLIVSHYAIGYKFNKEL